MSQDNRSDYPDGAEETESRKSEERRLALQRECIVMSREQGNARREK